MTSSMVFPVPCQCKDSVADRASVRDVRARRKQWEPYSCISKGRGQRPTAGELVHDVCWTDCAMGNFQIMDVAPGLHVASVRRIAPSTTNDYRDGPSGSPAAANAILRCGATNPSVPRAWRCRLFPKNRRMILLFCRETRSASSCTCSLQPNANPRQPGFKPGLSGTFNTLPQPILESGTRSNRFAAL